MESYDAYNIILDQNNKKNEEEMKVMKKYDIFNDENLLLDDDNQEMHEKIKEHLNNFQSLNDDKTNGKQKKNMRIRPINNHHKIQNLKVQTNDYKKKNDPVEAEDFKNFLNAKKQKVGQMSYDYTEHL